jgi:hypothetical protein
MKMSERQHFNVTDNILLFPNLQVLIFHILFGFALLSLWVQVIIVKCYIAPVNAWPMKIGHKKNQCVSICYRWCALVSQFVWVSGWLLLGIELNLFSMIISDPQVWFNNEWWFSFVCVLNNPQYSQLHLTFGFKNNFFSWQTLFR